MRTCCHCGAEYVVETWYCLTCGGLTLDAAQLRAWKVAQRELDEEVFVPVAVFEDAVEQALILEMLEQDEVPTLVHGHQTDGLGPAFLSQEGWALLLVPEEYAAHTRALVQEVRAQADQNT